jgi:hypothetical protein
VIDDDDDDDDDGDNDNDDNVERVKDIDDETAAVPAARSVKFNEVRHRDQTPGLRSL